MTRCLILAVSKLGVSESAGANTLYNAEKNMSHLCIINSQIMYNVNCLTRIAFFYQRLYYRMVPGYIDCSMRQRLLRHASASADTLL